MTEPVFEHTHDYRCMECDKDARYCDCGMWAEMWKPVFDSMDINGGEDTYNKEQCMKQVDFFNNRVDFWIKRGHDILAELAFNSALRWENLANDGRK